MFSKAAARYSCDVTVVKNEQFRVDIVSPVVIVSGHEVTDRAAGEVAAGARLFDVSVD